MAQGGEPGNPGGTQGGVVVEPPVNNISPDLSNLQDVVKAAQDAAGVQAAPTLPQTPVETQFTTQFGSDQTTPAAEPASGLDTVLAGLEAPSVAAVPESKSEDQSSAPVAPLVSGIDTIKDLLDKGPQVEQTPGDKLRQKISADIDAFLDEVTREKVAA